MKRSINISNITPKPGKGGYTIIRFSITLLYDGEPQVTADGHLYYNDRSVNPPRLQRGPQLVFWKQEYLDAAKKWLDGNEKVQEIMGEVVMKGNEALDLEGDVEL